MENCLKRKYFFEDELFEQENFDLNLINYNIYAIYYYFNKKNLLGFVNLYKISKITNKKDEIKIYANEVLIFNEHEDTLSKHKLNNNTNIVNLFEKNDGFNKLLRDQILKIND
tara:strand:- start:664 stop:1002 length:339 start_codon:yes stop_codon:yes gene_type:complete